MEFVFILKYTKTRRRIESEPQLASNSERNPYRPRISLNSLWR